MGRMAEGLAAMRVARTEQTSGPRAAARKSRAGGAGFQVDANTESAAPARAEGTGALASVVSVGALLALQSEPVGPEARRAAISHGSRLLDLLEEIRMELLMGELGAGTLQNLLKAVDQERPQADDPALSALLDEIDVRARVELAKHRMI